MNEVISWLRPQEWYGTILLDGRNVSQDCRGIGLVNEKPVALKLIRRGANDAPIRASRYGDIIIDIVYSDNIEISLKRRGVYL
jgi:hypothetical protein